MQIIDLTPQDEDKIEQAAVLLREGFREAWPAAWPNMAEARAEVQEMFDPERLSRVAVDENGLVLGWIGGISQYDPTGRQPFPRLPMCRRMVE
jgi:aminoglycoside 6'-N-acetyltransferase I